jgi:levanase/fructan beta-fructosidase
VQKADYSLDHGATLVKREGHILDHIVGENRDPKVYWHEPTNAYIMVLYLDNYDFAILRSKDLEQWDISQRLTLDKAWECPDLREIPVIGEESRWMFWCADGYYFLGDFDGYTFQTDGIRREAYKTALPYAAQTYSGVTDRVVTIPWLRTASWGKSYHGIMGIPRELTLVKAGQDYLLRQQTVKEFDAQKELKLSESLVQSSVTYSATKSAAVEIRTTVIDDGMLEWEINKVIIRYDFEQGILKLGDKEIQFGARRKDFSIIVDAEIVEITADKDTVYAVFEIETSSKQENITVTASGKVDIEIYELV